MTSHTLTWHLGSDVTSTPLHQDPTPGHRSLWELDPDIGSAYQRPSIHPNRRGRELSDTDADRQGIDAFYAASATRRPTGVDIESVVAALSRLGRSRRPDPLLLAIASVTAEICFRGQEVPTGLRRLFAKPERDARPAFRAAASVLYSAAASVPSLGMSGAQTLERAGPKGRTRASEWHHRPHGGQEVECRPTRAHAARVVGLSAVEMRQDAQRAVERAGVSEIDLVAVKEWSEGLPLEERLMRYRARMAHGVMCGGSAATTAARSAMCSAQDASAACPASATKREHKRLERDASRAAAAYKEALKDDEQRHARAIRWATRAVSDAEIRASISRARDRLERSLRRAPGRAEELVRDTGDRSWMMGLIPARAG